MPSSRQLAALGSALLLSIVLRANASAPGRCGFADTHIGPALASAGPPFSFGPEILSRRERLLDRGRACRERHPRTTRYLQSILARLTRSSGLDGFARSTPEIAFALDCSIPLPIAMATTGKLMSVPRALPALAASEDAIAAVLGHELAHLRLQHLEQRLGFGATHELELVRAQEREADRVGLDLAASAGYDPFAAIDHMRQTEALALALQRSGKLRAQPRDPAHADLETRQQRLYLRIRACGYRAPLQRTPVASAVKVELRGAHRRD